MTSKSRFAGERVKLGDIVTASTRKNRNSRCTAVYSVTNSQGFTPSHEYFNKEVFSNDLSGYRVVERGMIAYNPSRINVGSVALQDRLPEVVVSPLYVVFSVDTSRALPSFVLEFLKSASGLSQIAHQSTGTVRNNLKFDALCRMEITLPDTDTQESCVAKLEKVSQQIELCEKQLDLLGQLVKSQFVEMFGEPWQRNGRWPKKTLGATCEIITGNTPPRKDKVNYGDYVEWCKTDNITDSKYLTTAAEKLSEIGASKGRVAPAGSVLMACIAGSIKSIGKVAIADRQVAFNQQINALIPGEELTTDYLLWELRLSKDYLCSNVNMQLKGILNKSTLSAKEFAVPPLALQQEFADFVAQVNKSEFAVRQQIEDFPC